MITNYYLVTIKRRQLFSKGKFEQLSRYSRKSIYYFLLFRLEFMVARVKNDMDQIERQLSEAESTVEPTTASGTALKSIVPYIFVSLFTNFLQHTVGSVNDSVFQ